MHNIKTNFDKFYEIVKSSLHDKLNQDDNLQHYSKKPKMNDCSIITLSICAESIGIDSENYLWSKIKKDYKTDFPGLIDRSNLNKMRRRLHLFIHEATKFFVFRNDPKRKHLFNGFHTCSDMQNYKREALRIWEKFF